MTGYELGTAKTFEQNNRQMNDRVVWWYGSGVAADLIDDENQLEHPMSAQSINNDTEILVGTYHGAIIINRYTKEKAWTYSIGGGAASAYKINDDEILLANPDNDKVFIVKRSDKSTVWEYTETDLNPRYAIQWEDGVIAISKADAAPGEVRWVNRSDKSTVKSYTVDGGVPVGLTKLPQHNAHTSATGPTILISKDLGQKLEEVNYDDLTQLWTYGDSSQVRSGYGHFFNYCQCPHHAVRLGGLSSRDVGLTIIANNELGCLRMVNNDKRLVGTIGTEYDAANRAKFDPDKVTLTCPHTFTLTDYGTVLVADSHGHRVIEVDIKKAPIKQKTKNVNLWNGDILGDTWEVRIIEFEGYKGELFVENTDSTQDIDFQVKVFVGVFRGSGYGYLSNDTVQKVIKTITAGGQDSVTIDTPGNYVEVRARCATGGETIDRIASYLHLYRT